MFPRLRADEHLLLIRVSLAHFSAVLVTNQISKLGRAGIYRNPTSPWRCSCSIRGANDPDTPFCPFLCLISTSPGLILLFSILEHDQIGPTTILSNYKDIAKAYDNASKWITYENPVPARLRLRTWRRKIPLRHAGRGMGFAQRDCWVGKAVRNANWLMAVLVAHFRLSLCESWLGRTEDILEQLLSCMYPATSPR